jgi:hypothetical protein
MLSRKTLNTPGLTLLEVLVALFIFLVGIVGVLAALPTGISSAQTVILQDAAIHLAHSKFAEFRRDRVDPLVDLVEGSTYMNKRQEPVNASASGPWHDFAHSPGDTYEFFDDIGNYEWRVDKDRFKQVGLDADGITPVEGGGRALSKLARVAIIVHLKSTTKQFIFSQYMYAAGRVLPVDPAW